MTKGWSIADELEKLANLRDRGILSDSEFQTQKRQLLSAQPMNSAPPASTGFRVGDLANIELSQQDVKVAKWYALSVWLRHLSNVAKGSR